MIISKKPVSIAEVADIIGKPEEKRPIDDYVKSFAKLSKKDYNKFSEEIKALNNHKLKEESIVKLADFLPGDIEELSKVLSDAGLSEAEANSILEIIKKY